MLGEQADAAGEALGAGGEEQICRRHGTATLDTAP